jgi:biotin transport system substrate-specific component
MATTFETSNTLLGTVWPKGRAAQIAATIAIAFLGSVLLTIAAKTSVPTWPVPVSLQSMAVAIIAAAVGFRMAVATVSLYLVQGLAGIPVFAGAFAGIPYVLGPTGGFLIGFLVMAAIIGFLADRGATRNVFASFASMLLGASVLFVFGFVWLMSMSGNAGWIDQSDVVGSAFRGAVQPFIVWDILKMAFAAMTVAGGWAIVRRF